MDALRGSVEPEVNSQHRQDIQNPLEDSRCDRGEQCGHGCHDRFLYNRVCVYPYHISTNFVLSQINVEI